MAAAPQSQLDDVIIETRGLTKEFSGFVAVSDVHLRVRRGQIHALIGPNGAGKTTFFNLLTKFLIPDRGQILFRGRDITFRAHYPDGKDETLLVIPNYNFDWQLPYVWEPGKVRFPKGTRLECLAHYDNSAHNPFNPDPTATVREGPQTHHEMLNGFVFYTDANEQLNLDIDAATGRVRSKAATP